jgi:hypothetical protein
MRDLLVIILFLSYYYISYSQYYFKISDSLEIPKENIKETYLKFYSEKVEEKYKKMYFDFNYNPLEINSIICDSKFEIESVLNYGIGFNYNMDLDNSESIDFILIIDPSMTSFSLNFIKFTIVFYF